MTMRTAAADDWVDERTIGPFACRSEFKLRGDEAWITDLERLTADISQALQIEIEPGSIELSLFKNRKNYHKHLLARVPDGVTRQALFVQGTDMGRVYVYRHWDYEVDLRHECTHALLHANLQFIPMWLDEGLAEYFEAPDSQRTDGHPHLRSLRMRSMFGWKPDIRQLERKREFTEMNEHDYREAWAWTSFLLHGPRPAQDALWDYVAAIKRGESPEPLTDRLLREVPEVETQLVQYLKN